MNKKVTGLLLCGMMLLTGCSSNATSTLTTSTSEDEVILSDLYEDLPEDNNFELMKKDDLKTFIEHGTGILYFSFPECPWCQAYAPMLNDVLVENEASAYYYNIHTDKDEDRDFYDEIVQLLIEHDYSEKEDLILYGNDGKGLIYMPLTLFIEDGEIKNWNGESNTNDSDEISPEDYWTDEKVESLKQSLNDGVSVVKAAQEANNAKGCDTGCKVGE